MSHECKYEKQMERMLDKLDETNKELGKINIVLDRNTVSLEEHMKRTKLLEENLKPIRRAYDAIIWVVGIVVVIAGIWKAFS